MNKLLLLRNLAFYLICVGVVLTIWYLFGGGYIHLSIYPDIENMKSIQPFMTGFVAPIFSLAGILLLFVNFSQSQITQFENNFFKLLDNHHKIVQNISDKIEGIDKDIKYTSTKQMFFDDLAFRIVVDYNGVEISTPEYVDEEKTKEWIIKPLCTKYSSSEKKEKLLGIYSYYFHLYQPILGHYFRNLYHISKFIERTPLNNKKTYIGILRAQLSNYELLLIAYNGMYKYGNKKYRPLINSQKLLKSLSFELEMPEGYLPRIIPDYDILISEYPHLEAAFLEQKEFFKNN